MKAIETLYKGYRFRSRLEARWAVFFDALGLAWEYEPEGFELGCGERYLPDFRIGPVWYEVKPEGTLRDPKAELFSRLLDEKNLRGETAPIESCVLLAGDPLNFLVDNRLCPRCFRPFKKDGLYEMIKAGVACFYTPCSNCDMNNREEYHKSVFDVETEFSKGILIFSMGDWTYHRHKLHDAAMKARGARFEFGEQD